MKTLILASSSPRRIELLKRMRFVFEVKAPNIEESPQKKESPYALVKRLAHQKALAALKKEKKQKNLVILAADTIVVSPQKKILNKPLDSKDAYRMLFQLSGKKHTVLTAFVILTNNLKNIYCEVVKTKVKMKKLTPLEIKNYIKSKEPLDKAGAYAAQGIGMGFIESIQGSYTNVIGLPLVEVCSALKKHFKTYPR